MTKEKIEEKVTEYLKTNPLVVKERSPSGFDMLEGDSKLKDKFGFRIDTVNLVLDQLEDEEEIAGSIESYCYNELGQDNWEDYYDYSDAYNHLKNHLGFWGDNVPGLEEYVAKYCTTEDRLKMLAYLKYKLTGSSSPYASERYQRYYDMIMKELLKK